MAEQFTPDQQRLVDDDKAFFVTQDGQTVSLDDLEESSEQLDEEGNLVKICTKTKQGMLRFCNIRYTDCETRKRKVHMAAPGERWSIRYWNGKECKWKHGRC